MDIRTVGVLGAGTMGSGIAQLVEAASENVDLYAGFGDPKYRPCPLWREKVEARELGRKTGRGFFSCH